MSTLAQPATPPTPRSFAGMLADFTSPEKKFPPARDFDGLEDDIATLSYEHALKTHARYRPVPESTPPQQQAFPGSATQVAADRSVESAAPAESLFPAHLPSLPAEPENRKSASVTVRLTRAEDEQLRRRAAEAGMTISAYLRSCAFEVETLRAQVKQTIAEMRHVEPVPQPRPQRKSAFSRLLSWRNRSA